MRAVYRTVPLDVIEAIGRAPKVGRPRWAEFAKVFSEQAELHDQLRSALSEATAKRQASDQKFLAAFNALRTSQPAQSNGTTIANTAGQELGRFVRTKKDMRISASTTGREFLSFIEATLPELAERFERERSKD